MRMQYAHTMMLVAAMFAAGADSTARASDWIEYVDHTSGRLVADPALGLEDVAEKDFAWGDVDGDGDTDLVVVRKQPFTSPVGRANVLFLNESGVLVDRTALYASASDVAGDSGFLTPTNDRDVLLVDVTGDGRLDLVTGRCGGTNVWVQDPLPGDVDGHGDVDVADLLGLLDSWGACAGCAADIDASGVVDVEDLLQLLGHWTG